MIEEIELFLASAYSPSNLDSAPEKLRKAIKLLDMVVRREALRELTKMAQEDGLYDSPQEVLDDRNRH